MDLNIKETYSRPYIFIPKTILWIIKQRDLEKDNDNLIGINTSIILNLTSLVESFNKELMISWIKNHTSKFEPESELEKNELPNWEDMPMGEYLLERLTDELILEIESSEWNKQLRLFTKITNDDINRIIEKETLIGMNQLFKYRNILTHGNKLSLIEWTYDRKTSERLEPNKFEGIFTFLKQQNLVTGKLKDVKSDIFELTFSNEVVDYFIEIINKYLDEIKKSFEMSKEINKTLFELKI
ncbi:hypothetical protein SCB49_13720 [unidentified eubacterium SCB49]|nr:hypothetical protein SCB49_13720 [unidentified eubacterium SCB49]